MTKELTLEEVKQALPLRKNTITQEVVDILNKSATEPAFQGESLMRTAVTYESILKGSKISIKEYLNAIRFCAYLMTVDDNYTEAYKKTFFDREFVKSRMNEPTGSGKYTELTYAASRYAKCKTVVSILTLSQAPLDIMFAGARYKAIGVLADKMFTAKYDKDQINAAKELLAATKNENTKIELEIGPSQEAVSMQSQLNKQLNELAMNQKKMLDAGYGIKEVQTVAVELNVIEGELDEG